MLWRRRLQPIAQPLFRLYARTTRSMTLGVRGAVMNDAGEVLLVEHTYMHGWHLPGGGVETRRDGRGRDGARAGRGGGRAG